MSDYTLAAALLSAPGIVAVVSTRRALGQLPQGSAMPALAYEISSNPAPVINQSSGPQLMRSRLSTTALGRTIGEVESVRDAVRSALDFLSGLYATHRVVAVLRDSSTSALRDTDAGVWYATTDYIVHWYE